MSLTILCDLDSTITDMHRPWLEIYNREYNDNLTTDKLIDWNTTKFVKPECDEKIYNIIRRPGFFLDMPAFNGAIEATKNIVEAGHDLYIMSDCFYPINATEKIRWCKKNLSFVKRDHIIIGAPKHMFRADVFIDDSPGQIKRYRQAWGKTPFILSIAFPYNKCVEELVDYRAESFEKSEKAWKNIIKKIAWRDEELDDNVHIERVPRVNGSSMEDVK